MKKNITLYSSIFIVLHLSGGIFSVITMLSRIERHSERDFNFEQVLHSYATLDIAQYLLVSLLMSALFIYSQSHLASTIIKKYITNTSPFLLNMAWAILSTLALLTINASIFSESTFSMPDALTTSNDHPTIYFLWAILILPVISLIYTTLKNQQRLLVIAIITLTSILLWPFSTDKYFPSDSERPNIIFIGIDSLRPELIDLYMPFLSEQLDNSLLFENAYTPFARTYPSWMSIVTGRHPVNHNARFNLQPESMLAPSNLYLPKRLHELGYLSIYASDERRFSNLGEIQGFEQVIGPKTGAADFILGSYADFPILNLLTISPIAKWLLPEIYANRAAFHLYQPQQFNELLAHGLAQRGNQPLFLSVHFCLAHWPYTFVGHTSTENYSEKPSYPANLTAIDEQIKKLLTLLDQQGSLTHSRVIFLSDHGESWGRVNTKLKNAKGETLQVLDHGHGMNILSPSSHKVLIALKGFNLRPGRSDRLSSLIDISPTIADELGLSYTLPNYDGHSLLQPTPRQIELSFESGIVMAAANRANPDPEEVAKAGLYRFKVLSNGLLRLKEENIRGMLQKKQLGLRINQKGIFRGFFGSKKSTYLLMDYHKQQYQELDTLTELYEIQPTLFNRFCELFSASHTALNEECVRL
ncbi:MAG: sulfatase-like hydrolase/transferase [Colwellia sp.]